MTAPWTIHHGDVRLIVATLAPKSFDAILCDPPYGLSFMGQRWDYRVPSSILWGNVLEVLKPGAHGMIFGGSRTFHRLAVAVEDGGFDIRDVCMWLYTQGFPKSLDIAKAIDKKAGHWRGRANGVMSENLSMGGPNYERTDKGDAITDKARAWEGYGTALKPAYEPILVVRRRPEGTTVDTAMKYGTGGIDLEQSKVGDEKRFNAPAGNAVGTMFDSLNGSGEGPFTAGYWPANIVGDLTSGEQDFLQRYFYTPKAGREERDAGLDDEFEARSDSEVGALRDAGRGGSSGFPKNRHIVGNSNHSSGSSGVKNHHPTVKPIDLIRYFARMILPPPRATPRRILVPFSGSGSEMIGCLQAGWDEVVGIEREAKYIEIAKGRISNGGVMHALVKERRKKK